MHSIEFTSVGLPAVRDGLTRPLGIEISNLDRRYRIQDSYGEWECDGNGSGIPFPRQPWIYRPTHFHYTGESLMLNMLPYQFLKIHWKRRWPMYICNSISIVWSINEFTVTSSIVRFIFLQLISILHIINGRTLVRTLFQSKPFQYK